MPDNETQQTPASTTAGNVCPVCGRTHVATQQYEPYKFDSRGVTQLTRDEAAAFYNEKRWESMTPQEIVDAQLYQVRSVVPMDEFKKALNTVLNRKVEWQEMAYQSILVKEVRGEKTKPTRKEKNDMLVGIVLDTVSEKLNASPGSVVTSLLSEIFRKRRESSSSPEAPEDANSPDPIGDLLEAIGAEKIMDADGISAYSLGKGN